VQPVVSANPVFSRNPEGVEQRHKTHTHEQLPADSLPNRFRNQKAAKRQFLMSIAMSFTNTFGES